MSIGDATVEGRGVTATCDAAIDCALEALAQRKIGGLRWLVDSKQNPGYTEERVELFMTGDGTLISRVTIRSIFRRKFYAVERLRLESDAYYSECAAKPSAVDRFECVRRVQKTGMSVEMCTEEFTHLP